MHFLEIVPAQFTTQPQFQTNHTAGEIYLSCAAAGIPPPTITWMKNGVKLNESSRISIESSEFVDAVFGETNSSVRMEDIVLADAGVYHCVANNTGAFDTTFTAFSARVIVTVLCKLTVSLSSLFL